MIFVTQADPRVWTVAEAKARLSEVLRLSEEEGPQRIGTRKCYVVVPEDVWQGQNGQAGRESAEEKSSQLDKPLGQWLIENMPCGVELELPSRKGPDRPIPFVDY